MKDYLLYTSAGKAANIKQWYSSPDRNYDIWVTNYSDIRLLNKEYSDYYNQHKGSKFQNLYHIYKENRDMLSKYAAIMVIDDDVIISPRSLSLLFDLMIERNLWLLQPAFSRIGKISHPITKRQLISEIRYTNFVEITCPIIKTNKLIEFLKVYRPEISTCAGLDYWMPYYFGIDYKDKYAISDKFYCINPRTWRKPGRYRPIDLITNKQERIQMVDNIYKIIGIKEFKYHEYKRVKRRSLEVFECLPFYIFEIIYSKMIIFISNFLKVVKKFIKHRS